MSYILALVLTASTVAEITEDSVAELQAQIPETGTMELYFASPGGSVFAGLEFIRSMEQAQARGVRFVCTAEFAASMALPIFATCDERIALPRALFMIHPASGEVRGDSRKARAVASLMDAVSYALIQHIASRSNVSAEELSRRVEVNGGEYWFTAADAKAMGLVQ